ncbi:MAG TPA: hypothetical protein VJK51_02010 [Candidatus Nanoarchaeia archaeon]|nr:hypothetical protein [Candidatus Nanoarchaeia archaeon]
MTFNESEFRNKYSAQFQVLSQLYGHDITLSNEQEYLVLKLTPPRFPQEDNGDRKEVIRSMLPQEYNGKEIKLTFL